MAYPNQLMNQAVKGGGNLLELPRFGTQQQGGVDQILNQLRTMGIQGLQNPTQGFNPIEQASRRGFENRTIPLLAERFGGLNATGSSGYNNALTGAGTDYELGLNAQRSQFGQQNISQLLQMLQLGLQPSTENVFTPPGGGFGSGLGGGLGSALGLGGTLGINSLFSGLGGAGTAATGAEAGGSALAGAGGLAALAAQPWFWPVLGALGIGGGIYGLSQLSGD